MLMESLEKLGNLKLQLDVTLEVEDDAGKTANFPMRTRQYEVTSRETLQETLAKTVTEVEFRFDEKALHKSNLKIKASKGSKMHYTKYNPLKAGAFIPLPDCIKSTKSCINIQNEDKYCFKYCVLCAVNNVHAKPHPEKISAYNTFENQTTVNFDGLLFPMPVDSMDCF